MTQLTAHRLGFAIDGRAIVSGVSFAAGAGEFIGLVGPNGAGKSTLLRLLAGLLTPSQGQASIASFAARALNPRERARRLAYLPQLREVHWDMSVEAIVALGRYAYGAPAQLGPIDHAAVERALTLADAAHLATRVATTLSGGEQARVHLARAFAADAPILIADEPTAALDPRHSLSIAALLRAHASEGRLVIAALHDLDLASRFCTRLLVMAQGAIVKDGSAQDCLDAGTLEAVFGVVADQSAPRASLALAPATSGRVSG